MNDMESVAPATTRKHNHKQRRQKNAVLPHDAAVIIDIAGRITECTPEASTLLGQHHTKLSGLALTEVIPKLPFCSTTPYYNLAYAVFHSGNGRPMHRTALAADGRKIPVEISLSRTVIKGRHLIKVNLAPVPFGVMSEAT